MSNKQENNTIEILDEGLKQGFTTIPRTVLKAPNLSMQAKLVFALLLDYAWQKGSCFPGQARLAQDLSVHKNTIRKHLHELKDYGLLTWKQRGLNRTNVYYIQSLESHSSVTPQTPPDVIQDVQADGNRIEEAEYKKKEYKQPLTLANDNEQLNLNTFDSEAIAISKELNDEKSIKYYQKLIQQKKKGELYEEDISAALNDTRRMIRTDEVDGKKFLRNPASWFVSVLQKLTTKRKENEQKAKVEKMLQGFSKSFTGKITLFLIIFLALTLSFGKPVLAKENSDITIDSVLEEHNKIREQNNFPDLKLNEKLTKSAYLKAVTMRFGNCWSHYCSDSPWTDFKTIGYDYDFAGENLAHGFVDSKSLMDSWMDSPTHKANILNSHYTEIGIAVVKGKYLASSEDILVVVHFGKPTIDGFSVNPFLLTNKLFMETNTCWNNY